MRGAWGKPYGTVARVNIGQIILSIRCKDNNAPVIQEALRRARYKFPGRQKIIVSKKWGFTNVDREDYMKLKEEKRVVQCVSFHFFWRDLWVDTFDVQGWRICTVYSCQGAPGTELACTTQGLDFVLVFMRIITSDVEHRHIDCEASVTGG